MPPEKVPDEPPVLGAGILNGQTIKHLGVSKKSGTPKSSILIGFFIINHPFWGTPIFGNTHFQGHLILQDCGVLMPEKKQSSVVTFQRFWRNISKTPWKKVIPWTWLFFYKTYFSQWNHFLHHFQLGGVFWGFFTFTFELAALWIGCPLASHHHAMQKRSWEFKTLMWESKSDQTGWWDRWLMFLCRPFRKCSWLMFRAHDQCCWGVSTVTPASWRNLVWWILTIDTELSTKLENINITFWGPWRCMNVGERTGNLMHLVTQCHRARYHRKILTYQYHYICAQQHSICDQPSGLIIFGICTVDSHPFVFSGVLGASMTPSATFPPDIFSAEVFFLGPCHSIECWETWKRKSNPERLLNTVTKRHPE